MSNLYRIRTRRVNNLKLDKFLKERRALIKSQTKATAEYPVNEDEEEHQLKDRKILHVIN